MHVALKLLKVKKNFFVEYTGKLLYLEHRYISNTMQVPNENDGPGVFTIYMI